MKRLAIFTLAFVLLLSACSGPKQELPEKVQIEFYHDTVCGSCDGTAEFYQIMGEQLADVKDSYPYEVYAYNIYEQSGKASYQARLEEMGLDADSISLPLMIAGGRLYSGMDTIETNMKEAYLVAGEDLFVNKTVYNPKDKKTGGKLFEDYKADKKHLTVVYFYRITCEECQQTSPVIDSLPAAVTVDGKDIPVDVVRINTRSGNNGDRVTAFFDAYNVPDEDRMVPIVFVGERYLAGYEAISAELLPLLEEGTGLDFTFPKAA